MRIFLPVTGIIHRLFFIFFIFSPKLVYEHAFILQIFSLKYVFLYRLTSMFNIQADYFVAKFFLIVIVSPSN